MIGLRADVEPSLLDVVPWSYGYGHSWALAAVLADERTQGPVLAALRGLPGSAPHRIHGPIVREKGLTPRRADLAFALVDTDGRSHPVAVETKVNDPFDAAQVRDYRAANYTPVLNLPASTGLLLAVTDPTDAGEIRLTPEVLIGAVRSTSLSFSRLLEVYFQDLEAEWQRAERARARARGDLTQAVGNGLTPTRVLEDVAWIAEVYRALPAAAATAGVGATAEIRIEANDRGFFYAGSYAELPTGGALWVDVLADVRTGARAVAIKAGEADLAGAWDAAAQQQPEGDGWRRTARRLGGKTSTVWKIDAGEHLTAPGAARRAVDAAVHIRAVTA